MEQERDKVKATPESGRCRGNVKGVEWGAQSAVYEYRRWQHRGKDLASTYVLCPCRGTGLSLILEESSRGDTRRLIGD